MIKRQTSEFYRLGTGKATRHTVYACSARTWLANVARTDHVVAESTISMFVIRTLFTGQRSRGIFLTQCYPAFAAPYGTAAENRAQRHTRIATALQALERLGPKARSSETWEQAEAAHAAVTAAVAADMLLYGTP